MSCPTNIHSEDNILHRRHNDHLESYWRILKLTWWMATLGHLSAVYNKIRKSGLRFTRSDLEDIQSNYVSLEMTEWMLALQYLITEWKMSRLGCTLFIPLSLGLLQIDAIFENVLARTASMSAFIFSVAGLALSIKLLLNVDQFSKKKCRNQWAKASQNFCDIRSVEFWSLLAFPMSLLIWSVTLCVIAVLILAWNSPGALSDSRARARKNISATFLLVLTMTLTAFLYRCKQISRRLL